MFYFRSGAAHGPHLVRRGRVDTSLDATHRYEAPLIATTHAHSIRGTRGIDFSANAARGHSGTSSTERMGRSNLITRCALAAMLTYCAMRFPGDAETQQMQWEEIRRQIERLRRFHGRLSGVAMVTHGALVSVGLTAMFAAVVGSTEVGEQIGEREVYDGELRREYV